MKTAGLLGGMSYESTIQYYKLINKKINNRLGNLNSAKILLYSFNFEEIEALQRNGEWDKWYPWFDMDDSSSAGRFSFCAAVNRYSASLIGSRLCFKSKDLATDAGTQLLHIYKDFFTVK